MKGSCTKVSLCEDGKDEGEKSGDRAEKQDAPIAKMTLMEKVRKDLPPYVYESLASRSSVKLPSVEVSAAAGMGSQQQLENVTGGTAIHSQQLYGGAIGATVVKRPAVEEAVGAAEIESFDTSLEGETGRLGIAMGTQSRPVSKEDLARRLHLSSDSSVKKLIRTPPQRAPRIQHILPLETMPEKSESKMQRFQDVWGTMDAMVKEKGPEEDSNSMDPEKDSTSLETGKRERSRPRKRISVSPKFAAIDEKSGLEKSKSSMDSSPGEVAGSVGSVLELQEAAESIRYNRKLNKIFVESAECDSGGQVTVQSAECGSKVPEIEKREADGGAVA